MIPMNGARPKGTTKGVGAMMISEEQKFQVDVKMDIVRKGLQGQPRRGKDLRNVTTKTCHAA